MAPDSSALQAAALVSCLLVALLFAWLLDRPRRWPMKVLAAMCCALVAMAAAAVALNRELELYPSWSELWGHPAATGAGGVQPVSGGGRGSQVVRFTVVGRRSHLTMPALAYMPAGYAAGARRFPVVEVLDGYPGSPFSWLRGLRVAAVLDAEIAAGRMAPTVVVFPYQTMTPSHDTECVNAVGGPQVDTFLTADVRSTVARLFRVRTDRAGWGLIGYSTGGFCAANLALRHPDLFVAAASLSGYFQALTDRTTGDLYRGDRHARDLNSPLWRVRRLPVPPLAMYLASARDDRGGYADMRRFVAAARAPLRITTALVQRGGHSRPVWRALEGPALDWLSSWLAGPAPAAASGFGALPVRGAPARRPAPPRVAPSAAPRVARPAPLRSPAG